jgi:hypothetical protein
VRRRTLAIASAGLVIAVVAALSVRDRFRVDEVSVLTGAIITQDRDPNMQRPIQNASIIAEAGLTTGKAVSEGNGFFQLRLKPAVAVGESIALTVQHRDHLPFAITTHAGEKIYVLRLTPTVPLVEKESKSPEVPISDIRVRYATRSRSTLTIGTAVRTFEIENTGNIPCQGQPPCSPDGKWKATIGSLSLDAGEDNKHFQNVRLSCIAGPCPFTAIDSDRFSRGGNTISVSVRNWSDPVTYLLEAEVVNTMEVAIIRYTYPVTFGRSMNFTLPATASGPSIEADVAGSAIVYPLGPALRLSWATCRLEDGAGGTQLCRCELKPGYRFE